MSDTLVLKKLWVRGNTKQDILLRGEQTLLVGNSCISKTDMMEINARRKSCNDNTRLRNVVLQF